MRFHALACDFDGTLAYDSAVDAATLSAIDAFRASGRHMIMVTGRRLSELQRVFGQLSQFTWVIAENGAHLYHPSTQAERLLGTAPPDELAERLASAGVKPLERGRVILATWRPHEIAVIEAICELGLEHQVIFNKGAVMVLPPGVNKGSGLLAVCEWMGLSPHNVVSVGDAENDHALLRTTGFSVAVANAVPALQAKADWVTPSPYGQGVTELLRAILRDDLSSFHHVDKQRGTVIGKTERDEVVRLPTTETCILIAGPSGSGKSTLMRGFLSQWRERGYQFCLIDPEGDYEGGDDAVVLGSADHAPPLHEVVQVLHHPHENVVVNLLGIPLTERPAYLADLLPLLHQLRAAKGRPHWLVIDEAHHFFPSGLDASLHKTSTYAGSIACITVHPDHMATPVLDQVHTLFVVGKHHQQTLRAFAHAVGTRSPTLVSPRATEEQILVWDRLRGAVPYWFVPDATRQPLCRHRRKYAHGNIRRDQSFFFRGPQQKLNLCAHNLMMFLHIAEGVDDETWNFHLHRGDYTRWFDDVIKDRVLARETEQIAINHTLSARHSRAQIRALVERRYTAAV